jgi:hypothetical protein
MKCQPYLRKAQKSLYLHTLNNWSSGVLHLAGSYAKAVVMPDLGDLALLVKDEGYHEF